MEDLRRNWRRVRLPCVAHQPNWDFLSDRAQPRATWMPPLCRVLSGRLHTQWQTARNLCDPFDSSPVKRSACAACAAAVVQFIREWRLQRRHQEGITLSPLLTSQIDLRDGPTNPIGRSVFARIRRCGTCSLGRTFRVDRPYGKQVVQGTREICDRVSFLGILTRSRKGNAATFNPVNRGHRSDTAKL